MASKDVEVSFKELGLSSLEKLYIALSQQIVIRDDIKLEGELIKALSGDGWTSHVGVANGEWLYDTYAKYGSDLFSANYRGFMGLGKRKRINTSIRQTAENSANDFFVFNNGISILTTKLDSDSLVLEGLSIINGAQTTGSISSVSDKNKLKDLRVMCKVIVCNDPDKVKKIVEYNNTQNHITTWDHYTNSPEQKLLVEEFKHLGYTYSLKRGFDNSGSVFGIESVAQPLIALHGDYTSANRGKNYVFETKSAYDNAFQDSKAQHILLAYCISKAVESVKSDLKRIQTPREVEAKQLNFLQSLKSKYFILSIVGKIMDELIRKPTSSKLVKFSYNASLVKNNSLDALISIWRPAIKAILPTIITHVGNDLHAYLESDNPLDNIASEVKNTIETIRSLSSMEALDELERYIE